MTTSPRRWPRHLTSTVTAVTAGVLVLGAGPTSAAPGAAYVGTRVARAAYAVPTAVSQHTTGVTTGTAARTPAGRPWPGHPGRRLVPYRVHRGDTATGLAVRFHAWTAELRSLNHLGRAGHLRIGQRILIPVVTAAAARHHHTKHKPKHTPRHKPRHNKKHHGTKHRARPWRHAGASRAHVRRVVVRAARHHRVDPELALAIAWQESGWQQRRISSAGAIGVMQVLPGTATWMSGYVDRRLNPYGLHDNVTAGVVLLRVLRGQTTYRRSIGSYYQGLGSMRRDGPYRSTRAYTRNVVALRHRLERGWNPL